MTDFKICTKCKCEQSKSDFRIRKRSGSINRTYISPVCKKCEAVNCKQRYRRRVFGNCEVTVPIIDNEFWLDIPGYEGYYQASSLGRIKSIRRDVRHPDGGDLRLPERLLIMYVNKYGYREVILSKLNKKKTLRSHRLIASAFFGEVPDGMVVNHINGVKDDNRICNLEYVTLSQNSLHSVYVLGNRPPNGHKSKLSKEYIVVCPNGDILEIKGICQFARDNNLNMGGVMGAMDKKGKKHKGFEFKRISKTQEAA